MSHQSSDSSRLVAPRPRRHRAAPETAVPCDSSSPPVLLRLPNLDRLADQPPASTQTPAPCDSTEPGTSSAPGETPLSPELTRLAAEPNEPETDADALAPAPPTDMDPAETDWAAEPVTDERRPSDQPESPQRVVRRPVHSGTADRDWRGPAYKLGGTLVAAVLVVFMLMALNRGNDDPAATSIDPSGDPHELAQSTTAATPDIEVTVPFDTANDQPSKSTIDTSTSIDQSWLAENLSSPNQTVDRAATSAEWAAESAKEDTDVQHSRPAMPAESSPRAAASVAQRQPRYEPMPRYQTMPRYEPSPQYQSTSGYPQTGSGEVMSRYERTADSAWTGTTDPSHRSTLTVSPERPAAGPPGGEASASSSARQSYEYYSATSSVPEQTLPERFRRDDLPTTNRSNLAATSDRQPPRNQVAEQGYPSTPHVAAFGHDRDGFVDTPNHSPAVRTAERGVPGYGWSSPQSSDTGRAPARLQGRIEPYETGTYEHYR